MYFLYNQNFLVYIYKIKNLEYFFRVKIMQEAKQANY